MKFILFRYIYYLPQTIPFFIYVYPSAVYMNQFRQTKIVFYLFKKRNIFISNRYYSKRKENSRFQTFRVTTEIVWTISLYRQINSFVI
jgi:hypothetical protein